MAGIELVFGAGKLDRCVCDTEQLLVDYRRDGGYLYLEYCPILDSNYLYPEDLAVSLLMNSRAGARAFRSLQRHGSEIDLTTLPRKPLEQTTDEERRTTADIIAKCASWEGFAASVATKTLHKKWPALIPILDNQAIFGSYMYPQWPKQRSRGDSVRDPARIKEALDWIAFDLTRVENISAWQQLRALEPARSLIEIFDMVWWMYFRKTRAGLITSPRTPRPDR